ncbi:hypothetical protein HDC92_002019 [Pedobacter sp. AK017]|nr:hypothetical protein [Pedobacter sp. AK017]
MLNIEPPESVKYLTYNILKISNLLKRKFPRNTKITKP